MPLENLTIPEQSAFEVRFSFIKDETLRTNTAITFRYIFFLIKLEQETALPGPIIYSLYKDMIVQTGAVVESCVHYTLKYLINEGKIKSSDVMESEWREEKCVILETLDNGDKQVCGVTRHKAPLNLTKYTSFMDLNRACKRAGIYNEVAFTKAEALREARNKIHLAGLAEVDDIYTKEDVDKFFEYANTILTCLEDKLKA
jgi:hypothetical protein